MSVHLNQAGERSILFCTEPALWRVILCFEVVKEASSRVSRLYIRRAHRKATAEYCAFEAVKRGPDRPHPGSL